MDIATLLATETPYSRDDWALATGAARALGLTEEETLRAGRQARSPGYLLEGLLVASLRPEKPSLWARVLAWLGLR